MSHNLTLAAYAGHARGVLLKRILCGRAAADQKGEVGGMVSANLQDDPGSQMAPTAMAPRPVPSRELAQSSAFPAAAAGRHRYAVGVFTVSAEAYAAVAALAPAVPHMLVISHAASGRDATAALVSDGNVLFRHIEGSGALASDLATMLSGIEPFCALGASVHASPINGTAFSGMERLFQDLVHHLAQGATVVIVHASGPEQQLGISRALLDARCNILLTHDVHHAIDGASVSEPDRTQGRSKVAPKTRGPGTGSVQSD
ncbi:hypothetical protein [Hyphomicrobium sp.]|uniref:hypothetical protein n=1 Tax=Hyphomicrobium sp. TaxID=82 RepID=UPI002FDE0AF8